MDLKTQHGYLLIADISGYTSFLAKSELEHAHDILTELLEIIVRQLTARLTLSKLEGDAIFVFAPESEIPRGETLLELIEATYMKFRDERESIRRRTTCQCNACRNIPTLDLKFMAHHGDYMLQRVTGIHELVGSDVNLIHRLLKNHVSEQTGWRAYALFSEAALMHMGVRPAGMHEQIENYEYLGDVKVCVLNLADRYQELVDARRYTIEPKQAHYIVQGDLPATPSVVWEWINDPVKRAQVSLQDGSKYVPAVLTRGRTGIDSITHCVHGADVAMVETVRDWRPFEYVTFTQGPKQGSNGMQLDWQYVLTAIDNHTTHLEMRIFMRSRLPVFLNTLLCKLSCSRLFPVKKILLKMQNLIAADNARSADQSAAPDELQPAYGN
jgi:hypothetical protein